MERMEDLGKGLAPAWTSSVLPAGGKPKYGSRMSFDTGRLPLLRILWACLMVGWALCAQTPDPRVRLTAEERAWLADHPVIRWSPDADYAPVEFLGPDGQPQGLAVEYVRLIEARLGIRLEGHPAATWDQAMDDLRTRKIDLLTNMAESEERRSFAAFSKPFLELPDVLIARQGGSPSMSLSDLSGRRVGFVKGYEAGNYIRQRFPSVRLEAYPDLTSLLEAVAYGRMEAAAVDMASASWIIERKGWTNLQVVGSAGDSAMVGLAVRSDWPELARILDKVLETIPPEERDVMRRRWIPLQSPEWRPSPLFWALLLLGALLVVGAAGVAWNRAQARKLANLDRELQEERDRRRRLERLQMEYISKLSFELRTPLTVVLGNLKLMGAGLPEDQVRGLTESALRACEQMNGMVQQLLDFEQIQQGRLQLASGRIELSQWLPGVVEGLRDRAHRRGATLEVQADSELTGAMSGDPERLQQAFAILVDYAAKGGPVAFRVVSEPHGKLQVEVQDGRNRDAAEAERLFDPFQRPWAMGGASGFGSGLGMSIAKALLEAHGGYLEVVAAPGQGTLLRVLLPLEVEGGQSS